MQDMQNERNRENRRARHNRARNKYIPDDEQQDDDIEEMVQAADGTWVPASQKKKHDRRG